MSRLLQQLATRLLASLAVSLLVFAVAQPGSHTSLLAGFTTLALVALVGARYAALSIRSRVLTVGSRSLRHRESYSSTPEPSHPDTAGRTRSRAPARPFAAA